MQSLPSRPTLATAVMAGSCASCEARTSSVCSVMEAADLERLGSSAVVTQIEPGRTFIIEGDSAADFFNIISGHVRLYKLMADGRQQIVGFGATGHFLGLATLESYAFSAEAIDEVKLCRFSRVTMNVLLSDFPALERRLLQAACSELVAAQEQMLLLGRKTALERVASFLSSATRLRVPPGQSATTINLPMSRQDIADYLGLTIETISRTMTKLRVEGTIALPQPDMVVVRDEGRLRRLAHGNS